MESIKIKDTIAYKIIRQMVDHIWGGQELSDDQLMSICRLFGSRGASWESLMNGSMDNSVILEECIESVIKNKDEHKIASRLVRQVR